MSALALEADVPLQPIDVSFVPKADEAALSNLFSAYHPR